MDLDELKRALCAEIDRLAPTLVGLSHAIHAEPELGYEEVRAHDLLTGALEQAGVALQRGAYGMDTAFVADGGRQGPRVAVFCEYDALPGLGHACGHNIIAAAGLGAGVAAAALAEEAGGRIRILGSPAEEGGGGKVVEVEQGALDGVDAALMVHPAGVELRRMTVIAISQIRVRYTGVAAHAAAAPHRGRNALDAAVLGYVNVAALRQHIEPDERVHGVFTEAGDKPNIVPATAAGEWYVRSGDLARLAELQTRVLACLQAGADAAGCTMTWEEMAAPYADLRSNRALEDLYVANAASLGRVVAEEDEHRVVGSTDMGNVSYVVPSIHPMIACAPPEVAIHSAGFADWAASPAGDRAVVDGAKAMAMTIADLWADPARLAAVRAEFEGGSAP